MSQNQEATTEVKPKTLDELQIEYNRLCNAAGDLQYKIKIHGEELEMINGRLREVNHLAKPLLEAKAKEQSEAKKEVEANG